MKEPVFLTRAKRILNHDDYKLRGATEHDYATFYDQPTVILGIDGRPVIVYLELDDDCRSIVGALNKLSFSKEERSAGMITHSRVVGYLPRITVRRDFCTAAAVAHQTPELHRIITGYAAKVAVYYQKFHPELYQEHQQLTDKVLPNWKIEDTIFTSGIVNRDNPLPYHFDTGNFQSVWSNMLVFKKDIKGGYLAVPEYDAGFALRDNSLFMFDGQRILHGVTPFTKLSQDAHRYSIVYYSLQRMWDCLSPGEEIRRIQTIRTEREERRMQRDKTGGVYNPDETHHAVKRGKPR